MLNYTIAAIKTLVEILPVGTKAVSNIEMTCHPKNVGMGFEQSDRPCIASSEINLVIFLRLVTCSVSLVIKLPSLGEGVGRICYQTEELLQMEHSAKALHFYFHLFFFLVEAR